LQLIRGSFLEKDFHSLSLLKPYLFVFIIVIKKCLSTFPQVWLEIACGNCGKLLLKTFFHRFGIFIHKVFHKVFHRRIKLKPFVCNKILKFSTFPQALLLLLYKYNVLKLVEIVK
jgi:hypothetical protein